METKHCHKCDRDLPVSEFYKNRKRKDGLGTACKECHKQENREYRQRHTERVSKKEADAKVALKIKVYSHYCEGDVKCVGCGFDDFRALSIDHINGDGAKQRRKLKRTGVPYYRWIIRNNYPNDLQVLCMNCQWIKRYENNEHNHH